MGPQPGPKQRPEALQGVDVDLAKPIAVLIAGKLAGRMADRAMRIAPRWQLAVDVILIGIHHAPRADRGLDDRADGHLLDVLQHANDHLPGPWDHPEDRWLLLLQGSSAPFAFEASPPAQTLLLLNGFGVPLMPGH